MTHQPYGLFTYIQIEQTKIEINTNRIHKELNNLTLLLEKMNKNLIMESFEGKQDAEQTKVCVF